MTRSLSISGPTDFARAFHVSRETMERLEIYVGLLEQWQKVVNLVAPSTLGEVWHRHLGDSAQIVDILKNDDSPPRPGSWVDLGSGGGFPGLVAAIMLADEPGYAFHLVESNGRKCAFLSDVIRRTGIAARVHGKRIEDVARQSEFGDVTIVSARALAPLDKLFALAEPFMTPKTVAYFLKGREVHEELQLASSGWDYRSKAYPSRTSSDGTILEIAGLQRTAGTGQ